MALPDKFVDDTGIAPNERQTIMLDQQVKATPVISLKDRNGNVIVLDVGDNTVTLYAKEWEKDTEYYLNKTCTITNGTTGTVSVALAASDLPYSGLWLGEFDVKSAAASNAVVYKVPVYIEVADSISSTSLTYSPITIAEIRLAIRDRCSADNFLLDNVEFSNSEIAYAIKRPVDYWNESLPPLTSYTYTPATFPYRYHWVEGVIGELLRIAAFNLQRNRMPTQVGGISVDDKARADLYLKLSDTQITQYKQWVAGYKYSINVNDAFGTTVINTF